MLCTFISDAVIPTLAKPSPTIKYVKLYARLSQKEIFYGNTLSINLATIKVQETDARAENIFTLDPPLGLQLRVYGSVFYRIWLRADRMIDGTLKISLLELTSTNKTIEVVPTMNAFVFISPNIRDYNLGIGVANHTFLKGSRIQLSIQFIPSNPLIPVQLYWNDWKTPTQVSIPCVDHVGMDLQTLGKNDKIFSVFQVEDSQNSVPIKVRLNVSSPFGIGDITLPRIKVLDVETQNLIEENSMKIDVQASKKYNAVYTHEILSPKGIYEIKVETQDLSKNKYEGSLKFWVAPFHKFLVKLIDDSKEPMSGIDVTILKDSEAVWIGKSDQGGLVNASLPSSDVYGEYSVLVDWKGWNSMIMDNIAIMNDLQVEEKLPIYNPSFQLSLYGLPLPGIAVKLMKGDEVIANGLTDLRGIVEFKQIPTGNYKLVGYYLILSFTTDALVNSSGFNQLNFQAEFEGYHTYALILILALTVFTLIIKKRRKVYSHSYELIKALAGGAVPKASSIAIIGNSGSGKTVLLQTLLYDSLKNGNVCVFITNVEFPSKIIEGMKKLGMDVQAYYRSNKLIFIDAYSNLAGKQSSERYYVSSLSDLTALGIKISSCLNESRERVDVFLDSFTPMFTALKLEQILSFIHSIGAKVKGNDGGFYYTLGTSLKEDVITKIEEVSDCVIETILLGEGRKLKRRLRIKKIRGGKFVERWVEFSVGDKGIVFYTNKPMDKLVESIK
ncbi:MAG: RAD55 family ATPase [Candidatus Bathyarchaeia archaeon]